MQWPIGAFLTPEFFLGPLGGLALSLYFSCRFLHRFEETTEQLVHAFQGELEGCNRRYEFVLSELMKLKERKAKQ